MRLHPAIHEGRLYLPASESGIPPLVRMIDGLEFHFFGKSQKAYMEVDYLISWHRKEFERGGNPMEEAAVKKLEGMKADLLPADH